MAPGAGVRLPGSRPRLVKILRNNQPQFVVTALFGLAISAVLALLVLRADQAREHAAFNEIAQQRISQATEHLHEALQDLVSLRALFESAGIVSRAQFKTYCIPLLSSDPAIQALEWIPAVPGPQREVFEQRARADGFANFRFTAHTAAGMRPEGDKSQYFPVYYVAPYHGNQAALGFDLASNPARRAALIRAATTGNMVATSRIVLVQAQNGGYGFLVFNPVYGATPGLSARREPIGFVLGVFKVADIVRPYRTAAVADHGLVQLAVFDITPQSPGDAQGQASAQLYPKDTRIDLDVPRREHFSYEEVLDVGGRQWRMVAYRKPSDADRIEAGIVLLAGVLATLLVLALMRQMMMTRESEAARELALRSDATKSQFLANVSHEMRTPLNGVIGMLDLLLQSSLRADQTRMAQVSRRSALNLLGIINDLLDFSKIEAGRFNVAQEPVPIRRLLDEEVETFRSLATKSGCDLSHRIDDAIPDCMISDDLRLRQVLSNLLSNAVKFSSGQSRPGRVELLAGVPSPGQIEIAIVDNGIGIDAATQARLFQPFEQADLGTTKRYGGTGLGLTITRHLVELMGGTITLRSEAGVGSRFTVRLPLRACGGSAMPPAAAAVPSGQPGEPVDVQAPQARHGASARRVLLAEDNVTNQEVIRLQLARCGFDADIAPDGAKALELFRNGHYRLVLSDLHMPELDGFGLARAIRALEREQGREPATLLAVTAAAQQAELLQARAAGMDGHLVKPIRLEDLRDALQRWSQAQGRAETPGPSEPASSQSTAQPADAQAVSPAQPRVDLQVLRDLVGDDAETVRALLAQYAADLDATMSAMVQARDQGDRAALGGLAHRLKSSSRTVGALDLGELCQRLESACRQAEGDEVSQLLACCEQEAALVQRELAAGRASTGIDDVTMP